MRVVQQKLPKIILFFVALPFMAVTMSAGSVQALSLEDTTNRVTQPVQALLNPITQAAAPRSPQAAPQATQNSNNSAAAPTPRSGQSAGNQAASTTASPVSTPPSPTAPSTPLDGTVTLETMQPITQESFSNRTNSTKLASMMIQNPTGHSIKSDFGWLQATESGWQLFGLQWYWWAVLGAASWAGVHVLRSRTQA